jgi:hypothetical protein
MKGFGWRRTDTPVSTKPSGWRFSTEGTIHR